MPGAAPSFSLESVKASTSEELESCLNTEFSKYVDVLLTQLNGNRELENDIIAAYGSVVEALELRLRSFCTQDNPIKLSCVFPDESRATMTFGYNTSEGGPILVDVSLMSSGSDEAEQHEFLGDPSNPVSSSFWGKVWERYVSDGDLGIFHIASGYGNDSE